MSNQEKKWVLKVYATGLNYTSAEELLQILQLALADPKWKSLELVADGDPYQTSVKLEGLRLETDEEFLERMYQAKLDEEKRLQLDRETYERLKQQFEGK